MALDFGDSFDQLTDDDMWVNAVAVFAGFLAPTIVRNVLEGRAPWDVPDETYGLIVVAIGQYSPEYANEISLGGAVYTADKLAERADIKQSITQMGGS